MSGTENFNDYPKHPGQTTPRPYYVEIPLETFETMSEELAELRKHELAYDLDKARIKELEAENESIKYSVATLDTDIAMMKRWRKCSDEMPQEYDDGDYFLIAVEHESTTSPKGYYVTLAELVDGNWCDEEGRDIDEDIEYDLEDSIFSSKAPQGTKKGFYRSKVTHWMPLPKEPREAK